MYIRNEEKRTLKNNTGDDKDNNNNHDDGDKDNDDDNGRERQDKTSPYRCTIHIIQIQIQ